MVTMRKGIEFTSVHVLSQWKPRTWLSRRGRGVTEKSISVDQLRTLWTNLMGNQDMWRWVGAGVYVLDKAEKWLKASHHPHCWRLF